MSSSTIPVKEKLIRDEANRLKVSALLIHICVSMVPVLNIKPGDNHRSRSRRARRCYCNIARRPFSHCFRVRTRNRRSMFLIAPNSHVHLLIRNH